MASILNTVAKETITPEQVRNLPFIDVDISAVVVPIRSEREAYMLLKEIRGY